MSLLALLRSQSLGNTRLARFSGKASKNEGSGLNFKFSSMVLYEYIVFFLSYFWVRIWRLLMAKRPLTIMAVMTAEAPIKAIGPGLSP